MDSPPSTQRSQKKKLSRAQQLKEESEKFMQRPSMHIANPNKDLKQSYEKGFFKDKRFDHLRQLKKIRSKAEKDSVSSELDEDQEFSIERTHRKNRKKQASDEDKPKKKRGRKPKNQQENNVEVPKRQPTLEQLYNETQVAKKRGRPKGSVNKNKKQNVKKQQQKKMKQLECLKKIEPQQEEASSLQDESQSRSDQEDQEVKKKIVQKVKQQPKQNKQNESNKNAKGDEESQEQEDRSDSQQQSEYQENKEEQKDKKQNNLQESEASQDESQELSQNQNKNILAHLKSQHLKQQKLNSPKINNVPQKVQESVAPVRGKKLAINSPSPSENQQIIKNKKEDKKPLAEPINPKKADQQNILSNNDLPEQQELNKLIKKRGRKSQETQLQIQRLKQIIYQKKNNSIIFESKKQKIQQQIPRIQANKDESQSYQKESNQSKKRPRIISSMFQSKRNQEKPVQDRIKVSPKIQSKLYEPANKNNVKQTQSLIDRKQIQKEIMEHKMKKLSFQSKIYCEEIVLEEPIDPEQQKLFKKWTKYYKKLNQTLVTQKESDEAQHSSNNRKKAPKQKFKRYRKVIIQESCDDISEEEHLIKKIRKQKRIKQPRKIKKSKIERKHKDSSSSDSD